jgi:glutamine synthetase type III
MSSASPESTSSSSTTVTSQIQQHLTQLTADIVSATNSRNWDAKAYPWTHIAQDEFTAGTTFATLPSELDFPAFIQAFRSLYAEKPDYFIRPQDIDAIVAEKTGKATVYLTMENVNFTPGVLRYSFGRLEFVGRGNGFWQCVKYSSFPVPEGAPA